MEPMRFFAGGNTAEGFFSRFEDILPPDARKRAYFLKGGPGVGKSTLMRKVGARAEEAGLEVEYFHCASDPDSLDGVALPHKGVMLIDGTAPHVYDPAVPGARDTLLSLGDFLDEPMLRPRAGEIAEIMRDISERFRRCYCYLGAARGIAQAAACGAENAAKAERLSRRWCEALPLRGGEGSVRRLFASAVTPKGLLSLQDALPGERRFSLDCPHGLYATRLLTSVATVAASRGLDAIALCDPLSPRELRRVLIPAHGLCFAAEERGERATGEWAEAGDAFDLCPHSDSERNYDRNAYELMLERAVEQLRAAKARHDELERIYVRAMDFGRSAAVLERVLGEALG